MISDREGIIIEGETPQRYRIIRDGDPVGSFPTATDARNEYGKQRMSPGAEITILDGQKEINIQQLRKIADSEKL
jgi:hypothetical protein